MHHPVTGLVGWLVGRALGNQAHVYVWIGHHRYNIARAAATGDAVCLSDQTSQAETKGVPWLTKDDCQGGGFVPSFFFWFSMLNEEVSPNRCFPGTKLMKNLTQMVGGALKNVGIYLPT